MSFHGRKGAVHHTRLPPPLAGMGCADADPIAVRAASVKIPPLFQSYLQLGAKVFGPPAIDRQFKTMDFLVALDITKPADHSYRFSFG